MNEDLLFYFAQILTAIIALINGWLVYKTSDSRQNFRMAAFAIAILSLVFGFIVASSEHKRANRNDDTATYYRNLHTKLAFNQIDSSKKIIDTLDSTILHSRTLLSQNNDLIGSSKLSLSKLNQQVRMSGKIQHTLVLSSSNLLVQIDSARLKVQNQLSDENRYVYLYLTVRGNGQYFWALLNNFSAPVFLSSIVFTDYDKLSECKSEINVEILKVDSTCLSRCQTDLFKDYHGKLPFTVTPGGERMDNIKVNLTPGYHRYEIEFAARNHIFVQQMIVFVSKDFKLAQVGRVLEFSDNYRKIPKVLGLIKSQDLGTNKIDFKKAFPLPLGKLSYKM